MTGEELFWDLVEPMYTDPAVHRSTMMGLPCVRLDGRFFASLDRRTHALLVKPSRGSAAACSASLTICASPTTSRPTNPISTWLSGKATAAHAPTRPSSCGSRLPKSTSAPA
jgi:hypothetical protein